MRARRFRPEDWLLVVAALSVFVLGLYYFGVMPPIEQAAAQ